MAAVFLHDLRNERRLPKRREAVTRRRRRQTIEERVDEHDPSVLEQADIVGVDLARYEQFARDIAGVIQIVDLLLGPQNVLEADDLE
nr:hypothetical protein [Methyloceanibacter stevinii]